MEENEKPRKRRVMIHVKDLRKEYTLEGGESVVALKRINLDIMEGELCCIFGTSGSGKSTLLNQLAGLEKPTFGDVYIRGVPITRLSENQLAAFRQKHIGFVFQSYNLLPFMNAVENVAMPLMFRGVFADEPTGNLDSKTTIEVMDMIKSFARKYNQTIVLVTHDPELAQYADRIVTLVDGRIVSDTKGEHNEQENK